MLFKNNGYEEESDSSRKQREKKQKAYADIEIGPFQENADPTNKVQLSKKSI